MSPQIVRFTASHDQVAEVEKGMERLFDALADGASNPLAGIPEAATFRQDMHRWTLTPPDPEPPAVLANYRMLG